MTDNRPIGVFDSGIGGLTVLREIINAVPGESTIYFGDNSRAPYGTKSRSTVIRYSLQNMKFLESFTEGKLSALRQKRTSPSIKCL